MKIIKIFSIVLVLLLVGCGKQKSITCSIDINNNIEGYKMSATYKIYYKDKYATRIEKEENYESSNRDTILYLTELNELEYYDLKDKYGGIEYNIKSKENIINIVASIDLKEFDVSRFYKDGRIDKNYVMSNKMLINGIKKLYESRGAVCE